MAITAINAFNTNKTAFRAAQPAPKCKPETQAELDENFFEENKEVLLTLSAIGAAV